MQEAKAENTVQHLTQHLRQQDKELYSRSQDCEKSRHEQLQLVAELRNRERADPETLMQRRREVEELKTHFAALK